MNEEIKKIIKQLLINSNNDVLLANYIMSFIDKKCKICLKFYILSSQYIFAQKLNICTTCYKFSQRYYHVLYSYR